MSPVTDPNARAATMSSPPASGMQPPIKRVQHAGFVSRLAAFILDIVIVTTGSIVFAALVSLILNFFGFSAQGLKADDPTRSLLVVLQFMIVALLRFGRSIVHPRLFCFVLGPRRRYPWQASLGLEDCSDRPAAATRLGARHRALTSDIGFPR